MPIEGVIYSKKHLRLQSMVGVNLKGNLSMKEKADSTSTPRHSPVQEELIKESDVESNSSHCVSSTVHNGLQGDLPPIVVNIPLESSAPKRIRKRKELDERNDRKLTQEEGVVPRRQKESVVEKSSLEAPIRKRGRPRMIKREENPINEVSFKAEKVEESTSSGSKKRDWEGTIKRIPEKKLREITLEDILLPKSPKSGQKKPIHVGQSPFSKLKKRNIIVPNGDDNRMHLVVTLINSEPSSGDPASESIVERLVDSMNDMVPLIVKRLPDIPAEPIGNQTKVSFDYASLDKIPSPLCKPSESESSTDQKILGSPEVTREPVVILQRCDQMQPCGKVSSAGSKKISPATNLRVSIDLEELRGSIKNNRKESSKCSRSPKVCGEEYQNRPVVLLERLQLSSSDLSELEDPSAGEKLRELRNQLAWCHLGALEELASRLDHQALSRLISTNPSYNMAVIRRNHKCRSNQHAKSDLFLGQFSS